MKNYIMLFCAALGFAACANDFDTAIVDTNVFTAENVGEPNTTIAQIRSKYQSQISGGVATEAAKVQDDLIIEAIVTGNDISGNIYQAIYVQDVNKDGSMNTTAGGLQIAIKGIGSLAAVFPVGQKIRMNLKGLYVSGYGQMVKVGQPYVTASSTSPSVRIGPMAQTCVKNQIQLVGKPHDNIVLPREFISADISSLDKITPMLVVLHNCEIAEADGTAVYAPQSSGEYSVSRTLKLSDGKTVTLYNSCSATFASDVMPKGKLTVYGIMTRYNNYSQLLLRSADDVVVEK